MKESEGHLKRMTWPAQPLDLKARELVWEELELLQIYWEDMNTRCILSYLIYRCKKWLFAESKI